jgi:hypothetical protein
MITNYMLIGHSRDPQFGGCQGAPNYSPEQVRQELKGYGGLWLHSSNVGHPNAAELVFIIEAVALKKNLIITRRPRLAYDESMSVWRGLREAYVTDKEIPLIVENEDLAGLTKLVEGGAR